MIYIFYDIVLLLASFIYLPVYAMRGRVHREIWTRLGFIDKDYFKAVRGCETIWIHAVSVGEARAAESLLQLVRRDWPDKRIVVSTVTPTGQDIFKSILKEGEISFYAPLDVSWIVRKFLKMIQPRLLIIMETELWPNLIRLSHARGVRLVVVNGRISDKSYRRYKKITFFLKNLLPSIDLFCMQTDQALERIIFLGAPSAQVKMTGNIKFDISADVKEPASLPFLKKLLDGCSLWIAGSTHENEEEVVVDIYRSLCRDFPRLRLMIAPRHLTRLDKIRRMIKLKGLEAIYLSRADKWTIGQVGLLDTMGDLTSLYGLCDVAFVGGSLLFRGGHNPIEPALFAKPIIFGNHMENFREIRDIFIMEKAAIEVDSSQSLEYELRRLLGSSGERQALGKAAKNLLDKNRGAAQRTFSVLKEVLK